MKILIIGSGNICDEILLNEYNKSNYIISADGGSKVLYKNNLIPNVIIGDLDSIDVNTKEYYKSQNIEFKVFPTKKDKTDMDLCIEYAIELKPISITILGGTGTRLDHTLGNIVLLRKILDNNIDGKIIDSNNEIYLVKDSLEIHKDDKKYVSIIPFLSEKINVTTSGFLYEIEDFDIMVGTTTGISNELKDVKGLIKINKGIGIVIKSND